jgi:Thiol-disulfide isomerase and thioredoxins
MEQRKRLGNIKIIILLLLLITLISAGGCGAKSDNQSDQKEPQSKELDLTPDKDYPESIGLISFHTKDIYGNEVNQDIFSNYPLTLVNVWGTFCKPCLNELPDLGELQKEYAPKGVNVVGIVIDVQDEEMQVIKEQQDLAKQIVEKTGADYTHLLISDEMIDGVLNQFDAIPASFFVDQDGNIVSEFYIGSKSKKEWTDIIETMQKKQESSQK